LTKRAIKEQKQQQLQGTIGMSINQKLQQAEFSCIKELIPRSRQPFNDPDGAEQRRRTRRTGFLLTA
jgi:hypothetical protein